MESRNIGSLSCCAAYLRENVARRSHAIGNILYPQSFTVRELRHTLHTYLSMHQQGHEVNVSLVDAILLSLENQNFFYNGSWKDMAVASEDDVCIFLYCDEEEKPPRGVFPALANCYSPTCEEPGSCYSPSCRNRLRNSRARHLSNSTIKCYSPTCDQDQGCYSSTCPYRNLKPRNDPIVKLCIHDSPISSNGSSTPTSNAPTYWIGHYQPCIDRPRRSLSYLMGFATEETFTDFWIGTTGVR